MVDFSSAGIIGRHFQDPSLIRTGGDVPELVVSKSFFHVARSHFDFASRWGFQFNRSDASKDLNSSRSFGVGFQLKRVPVIFVKYADVSVGIHTYNKYHSSAYERLVVAIQRDPGDFWREFPPFKRDWLCCFPIAWSDVQTLRRFKMEIYRSYFIGREFPVQWEELPREYLAEHYGDKFKTFKGFSKTLCGMFC